MASSIHVPNIQMTTRERNNAVGNYRGTHAWATRFNPYPLLNANPGMSVEQVFEQLLEEDDQRLAELRARMGATGPEDTGEPTPRAHRHNSQATAERLFTTPWHRLAAHEQAQLRTLLDTAGRQDITRALTLDPTMSADQIIDGHNMEARP